MRKSESLLQLESLGLNTLESIVTKDYAEAMKYLDLHQDRLMSIRTERGYEFKCPFLYKQSVSVLKDELKPLLKLGYTLIISTSLDTEGCTMFGAIALQKEGSSVIEVVFGKGKVRELDTRKERISKIVKPGELSPFRLAEYPNNSEEVHSINSVYRKVNNICYDMSPCIVEFSYYNTPVGQLRTKDIYWEIREY